MEAPFITCLLITYRRPRLLQNALWLWGHQDYPADRRRLLILDDGDTFDEQCGENWILFSTSRRFPSLHSKYEWLRLFALGRAPLSEHPHVATSGYGVQPSTDIFCQYDDDDLYLPGYLSAHAAALRDVPMGYSKPSHILSDYMFPDDTGRVMEEPSTGRFPSCQAWRAELLERVGGFIAGRRSDADQVLIGESHRLASKTVSPWPQGGPHQYVFRWHDTGYKHSSGFSGEKGEGAWYDVQAERTPEVPRVGRLEPLQDEKTARVFHYLQARGNMV